MEITNWNVPKRCPRVFKSPILATQGMRIETTVPLTKPYTKAKTIIPA